MADLIRYEKKLKVIFDSTIFNVIVKGVAVLTPYTNKLKVVSYTT